MHKYSEFLKKVKDCKLAFSLAEVNIVLALIGIVAVLAISTLQLSAKAQYPTARLVFKNDLAMALAEMNSTYNLSDIENTADLMDKFSNFFVMPSMQPGAENSDIPSKGSGPKPKFADKYRDAAGNTVNFKPYDVEFKTENGINVRLSFVNAGDVTYKLNIKGNEEIITTKKLLEYAVDNSKMDRGNISYSLSNAALNYVTGYFDINGAKGPNKIGEDVGLIMPAYNLNKDKNQYFTTDEQGNFMAKTPGASSEDTLLVINDRFNPQPKVNPDPNNPNPTPNPVPEPCKKDNIIPDDYGNCNICALTKVICEKEGMKLNKEDCTCEYNRSCPKGKIQDKNGKCVCKNNKPALPAQGVFAEKDSAGNYLWNIETCSYKCELGASIKCLANGGTWNNETCSCKCSQESNCNTPYAKKNPNNYCACTCDEEKFNSEINKDETDLHTSASGKFHRTLYSQSINDRCFTCHTSVGFVKFTPNLSTFKCDMGIDGCDFGPGSSYSKKSALQKTDYRKHWCISLTDDEYNSLDADRKAAITNNNLRCGEQTNDYIPTKNEEGGCQTFCALTADKCKAMFDNMLASTIPAYSEKCPNGASDCSTIYQNMETSGELPLKNKANSLYTYEDASGVPYNYINATTKNKYGVINDRYLCKYKDKKGNVQDKAECKSARKDGSNKPLYTAETYNNCVASGDKFYCNNKLCTANSKVITFKVNYDTTSPSYCSCEIENYNNFFKEKQYYFETHKICGIKKGRICTVKRHGEMTISKGDGTYYTIKDFLIRNNCDGVFDPIVMHIPNKDQLNSVIETRISIKGMQEDSNTKKCTYNDETVTIIDNDTNTNKQSTWMAKDVFTNPPQYFFLVKNDKAFDNQSPTGTAKLIKPEDILFTDTEEGVPNGLVDLKNYTGETRAVVNELSNEYYNLGLWADITGDAMIQGASELNYFKIGYWPTVVEISLNQYLESDAKGSAKEICGAITSIYGYFKAGYPIINGGNSAITSRNNLPKTDSAGKSITWLERVPNGNVIEYRLYEKDTSGNIINNPDGTPKISATYKRIESYDRKGYSFTYDLLSGNDTLGINGATNNSTNSVKVYIRKGQTENDNIKFLYEVPDRALKLIDILFRSPGDE